MAAAAPAKGVMLCDRPVGGGGGGSGIGGSSSNGVVPFVSASNIPLNEQLGLPPCERLPFVRVQRDTVTHRHRRWLRTAVAEIKAKRDAEERKRVGDERRRRRLAEASKEMRQHILSGDGYHPASASSTLAKERVAEGAASAENSTVVPGSPDIGKADSPAHGREQQQQEEAGQQGRQKEQEQHSQHQRKVEVQAPPPVDVVADMEAFVDAAITSGKEAQAAVVAGAGTEAVAVLASEVEASAKAERRASGAPEDGECAPIAPSEVPTVTRTTRKKSAKALPAWARTAEEAEEIEEEEMDDLLGFVDGLDFNSYESMGEDRLRAAIADMDARAKEEEEKARREEDEAANADRTGVYATSAESADDEARNAIREAKQAQWRREFAGLMNALVSKEQSEAKAQAIEAGIAPAPADDAASVASHLMSLNKNLKLVHSNASLQRVVEQVEAESVAGDA